MFDLTTYEGEIEFGDVRDPRNMRPARVIDRRTRINDDEYGVTIIVEGGGWHGVGDAAVLCHRHGAAVARSSSELRFARPRRRYATVTVTVFMLPSGEILVTKDGLGVPDDAIGIATIPVMVSDGYRVDEVRTESGWLNSAISELPVEGLVVKLRATLTDSLNKTISNPPAAP